SPQFQRLNARWRIFQRISASPLIEERSDNHQEVMGMGTTGGRNNSELEGLRQQHRYLMETLRIGVFSLSMDDTITQHNTAALTLCGLAPTNLAGKRFTETDLFLRIPEIGGQLQTTRVNNESSRFPARLKMGNEQKVLEATIRPVLDERGQRCGTLIYLDDQSIHEKLQTTIEELESTSEELQSANEELETTNEELQSTNEELETTNQELEERTKELDQVNSVYALTLEKIRLPVMLVNQERHIEFWNQMALRLFGFKSKPPMDLTVEQLPLSESMRNLLIRRHRAVLVKEQPMVARGQDMGPRYGSKTDVHFSVIPREDRTRNVL